MVARQFSVNRIHILTEGRGFESHNGRRLFCSSAQLRFAILGGVEPSDLAEIGAVGAGDIYVRVLSVFMLSLTF